MRTIWLCCCIGVLEYESAQTLPRSKWLVFLCLIVTLLIAYFGHQHPAALADANSSPTLVGPYINSLDTDQATILWIGRERNDNASLDLRTGEDSTEVPVEVRPIPASRYLLYVVKAADLRPGTRYEFIYYCGNHAGSGSSRTLPASEEQSFTFALYGDSRTRSAKHRKIAQAIQHIVSGAAPLYPAKSAPLLANGKGKSVRHYCLFTVSPQRVDMLAKEPDGTIIDNLTVKRHEPNSSSTNDIFLQQTGNAQPQPVQILPLETSLQYQRALP